MIAVTYVFSFFLAALAVLLLITGVMTAAAGDTGDAASFLIASALWLFLAGTMNLALRGRERRLKPRERFLLAALAFTLLPVFASVPILVILPQEGFVNAYFEAVSGMTTTGWSALGETHLLPTGIVLWRAMLQWMGGASILLIVIFILAPSRVGGLPDSQSGPIDHSGSIERQRLGLALSRVLPLYLAITSLCFVLLSLSGVPVLDAFTLASAAIATSGFTSHSAPIGDYLPDLAIWTITIFSTVCATSFLWLRRLLRSGSAAFSHRESFFVVGCVLAVGLLASNMLYQSGGGTLGGSLRDGFSIAASIITTSGLEVRVGGHATLTYGLLLTLVFIGGASFSTAGGVKMFRIGAMAVQSGRELVRLVYPHAIRAARFGTQTYNIQIMKAIWSLLFAALLTAMLAAIALGHAGMDVDQAILGGFAAVSNMSISLFGDANTVVRMAALPDVTKLVLCAAMAVGRIEILAVLAAIYLPFWRN